MALAVEDGMAERSVVQVEFGKLLAGSELKVRDGEVGFLRSLGQERARGNQSSRENREERLHSGAHRGRIENTATSANKFGSTRASRLPRTKIWRSMIQFCSRQS